MLKIWYQDNLKNNASLEKIRQDPVFIELLKWNYSKDYLENQNIIDLRSLKQAINNQICLFVFQKFVTELWNKPNDTIPIVLKDKKIHMVSAMEWLNLLNISSIAQQAMDANIMNRVTVDVKKKIIAVYLWAFSDAIGDYFDFQIRNVQNTHISDIKKVFDILEDYTSTTVSQKLPWFWHLSWKTNLLIPNHNAAELIDFIVEQKFPLCLDSIKNFLEAQTREKNKYIGAGDKAMRYNIWATYLCPQDDVYKILEWKLIVEYWDCEVYVKDVLPTIKSCPFASSTIWDKNAFQLMFCLFNSFHLQLLWALSEKWVLE